MQIIGTSLVAATAFAVLAVMSTYPLVLDLGRLVPGTAAGDNLAALWNTWWFTRSLAGSEAELFRTPVLFAPVGTQLSLHTHSIVHSALAWPWAGASIAIAHNIAILIGLTLNGLVTFWLAHWLTRRFVPAFLAGWLFAASAFVHVHLLGHMNLLHAWVLPLFVLALAGFDRHPSTGRALLLGAAGALVLYTDYYFAVYAVIIVVVWHLVPLLRIRVAAPGIRLATTGRWLLVAGVVAVAAGAGILLSGGGSLELGSVRISLRSARNPLNAGWILLLAGTFCLRPLTLRLVREHLAPRRTLLLATLALATVVVLSGPLLLALWDVVGRGEYTAPRTLWRSSPPGGDVATLVLGHPAHVLSGGWTLGWYGRLGIDAIEQSLWIGIAPVVLLIVWRRVLGRDLMVARWLATGGVFTILALGPFLRVAGSDTGLTLPQAFLRYVPLASNARMPGRAVVVVQLSLAVLVAFAWSRRRPAPAVGAVVAAVLILEALPGRVPLTVLPQPDTVDRALAAATDGGGVIELPTGLRDGFGERGAFDHRALMHQMVHGRPLAGGFVARLSPSVVRQYDESPVLSRLLEISAPGPGDVHPVIPAAATSRDLGFSYLVVNRDLVGEDRLPRAEITAAGWEIQRTDGPRELFTVRR